jgi:hypothetical protein
MIEILHEVYRFAEEIQDATQQVATLGEINGDNPPARLSANAS